MTLANELERGIIEFLWDKLWNVTIYNTFYGHKTAIIKRRQDKIYQ